MRSMDVSRLRGSLAKVVDRVRARMTVVVIARYGRPIAALVPIPRLTDAERRTLAARTPAAAPAGHSRAGVPARGGNHADVHRRRRR